MECAPVNLSHTVSTRNTPATACNKNGPRVVSPVAPECLSPRAVSCPWHPISRYFADAPGRPGSARSRILSDSTREVIDIMVRAGYGASAHLSRPPSLHALALPLPAEHEHLHGLDVVQHRLPGRAIVACRDRREDAPVILVRPRRAAGRVE